MLRARSTADVSLDALKELSVELGADYELEVDESQIFLMSVEPPSWVTLLAEADWWIKVLAAYSSLYIAEIVKEAAKDTWKNRGKAISAAVAAANQVRRLAVALGNLRNRLPSRTRVEIALPVPDDYFATRIELIGRDSDDLAIQIALFVHHLPALIDLMNKEQLDRSHVAAGISVKLLPDASLHVRWQDNETLHEQIRVLSFTPKS